MSGKGYDVVVVGGGPGGLSAALYAAQAGLEVKLFEKKKEWGRPVRCGEYFASKEELARLLPRLKCIDIIEVPEEAIDARCKSLRFISPRGHEFEFPFEAYMIDRQEFEHHLGEKCLSYGVEVELNTRARFYPDAEGGWVGLSREEAVHGDIIIAADGYPSMTAEAAGLHQYGYATPHSVANVIEYLMTDLSVEDDVAEIYLDPKWSPGGYAWIFPKGQRRANVGIGIREPYVSRNVRVTDLIAGFIDKNKTAAKKLQGGRKTNLMADTLPVDGPLSRTYSDNVMAVGDAAGMIMPTNGGGIQTAMITGRLAGETAVQYFENKAPLSSYEDAWKEQIGVEMENSRTVRRASDKVIGHRIMLDLMLRLMGTKKVAEMLLCQMPGLWTPLIRLMA